MRSRKHRQVQATNPQIELSFNEKTNAKQLKENHLNLEMYRLHATEKKRLLSEIWSLNEEQLCDFFTSYQLFPDNNFFKIKSLLLSNQLKLIKTAGKIYFGQISKKKKMGRGIYISKEGKLYEGEFRDNERFGPGIQIYENGNLYMGEFLNNKKHGKGKFFWFNANQKNKKENKQIEYYEGEWWGGLPDGKGIHQKHNGDIYTGNFKNGLKHGVGQQYFYNGDFYKGEYINGLPEGFGEYLWKDKSYYKGDFKQGLRSGFGYWCKTEGQQGETYQGHYAMDKKSGYGKYEWENGWLYKGQFQNDYRNGYGELFNHEDKLVYKGQWQNGQKSGGQSFYEEPNTNTEQAQNTLNVTSVVSPKREKSQGARKKFDTFNIEENITKYKPHTKLIKTDFAVKKRPQSHEHLGKSEAVIYHHRYPMLKEEKSTDHGHTSIETSSFRQKRLNKLYVPWQHSSRTRK